jgi:foldase protein PrsA
MLAAALAVSVSLAIVSCTKESPPPASPGSSPGSAPTAQKPPAPAAEPDYVKVQHVLIGFKDAVGFRGRPMPPKAGGRTQEQAKTLAEEVFARAKKGEDFATLVSQYSDDGAPGTYTMSNHGKTPPPGGYPRAGMAAAFGDVGFPLPVGGIGMSSYDMSKSPFGWHIIKRLE